MSEIRVADIGEFDLIDTLRETLPESARRIPDLLAGIGDDAAVWKPTPSEHVLITTDSMVENVHFRLDWTDWRSLGWKAIASNVSDIAAMGGIPRIAEITLVLTGNEVVSDLQELYRGVSEITTRFEMAVAGGDIVSSRHELSIHVTVLGETRSQLSLRRSGAQPGDRFLVSEHLGASAAGLALLELEEDDPRRSATTANQLMEAHLRPMPRVELGEVLLTYGATAAMDLSDGLLGDLPKILKQGSGSGVINESAIPVPAAVQALFPDRYLEMAMRGGEDYELLATAPVSDLEAILEQAGTIGHRLTVIGEIIEPEGEAGTLFLQDSTGARREIEPGAFDHFRHPSS